MGRHKMSAFLRKLNSCLIFSICLISGMAQATPGKFDFYTAPLFIFQEGNKGYCSIVKVHSLSKSQDGKILHQEGVGWVVYAQHYMGVITPFHVVVGSDLVIAECKGQFYKLKDPTIDPEKDISYFDFAEEDIERIKGNMLALVWGLSDSDRANFLPFLQPQGLMGMTMINPTREQLDKEIYGLALGAATFGVAGPADAKTGKNTVLLSAIENDVVQPLIDKEQSYIKNLIRIENLGIRPGQSGSVLFGIPTMPYLTNIDSQTEKWKLGLPVQTMPKLIYGMITKTRLNGAETVALSIGDIYDFLEKDVLSVNRKYKTDRGLRVNYERIGEGNRMHLQSYITLHPDGHTQKAKVLEYCSEEYKNSAESVSTQDAKLLQAFNASTPDEVEQMKLKGALRNPFVILGESSKQSLAKAGGGEYGEGGGGFLSMQSEFLTSKGRVGRFGDLDIPNKEAEIIDSFGLYLSEKTCKERGLSVNGKLYHTVNLPQQEPIRLVNLEDMRHFYNKHGDDSLDLIEKYGRTSKVPFFVNIMGDSETLQVPLFSAKLLSSNDSIWRPGNHKYLKLKLASASIKASNQALQLTKNTMKLAADLPSFEGVSHPKFQDRLQLQFANNQWKASIAFGLSCRMEFAPQHFTQVNPYRVEYDDGKNKLAIDLNSQDRFLAVSLQKSECRELKDLSLAEVEVFLVKGLTAVIGTRRTALIPTPLDFNFLKTKYLLPTGGNK